MLIAVLICASCEINVETEPNCEAFMQSVCDIQNKGTWTGSGVVVRRTPVPGNFAKAYTFILTAKHVVNRGVTHVRFYDGTAWSELIEVEVVAKSRTRDLALLRTKAVATGIVARFACHAPARFDTVYVVGQSPVGCPLPNRGQVSGEAPSNTDMIINAPIYPGYSGGGVWRIEAGEWRLCGMATGVSTRGCMLAAHMAWCEPLHEILLFLSGMGW
jgi:S1-C subfamily serine protease